jgi:hypothetical protein
MDAKKKKSYYSKHLDELERIELKNAAAIEGIDEEVALLRFEIQQLIKAKSADPEELTKYVNTLCRSLLTGHAIGSGKNKQLKTAISNVVRDILVPMGVDIGSAVINKRL